MHPVADSVRRTITRFNLIPPASRVIVALSGGGVSVALAHVLGELAAPLGFELVGVAHLHHGLRGDAADEDERFCRTLAAALGLPVDVERADVAALAAARGQSVEEAGREARYAFLGRAASRARADRTAVGHTRDDQAETFLLRLLRGAGSRGLGGIHPRIGSVVRPLLEQRRPVLRGYLADIGVAWREDATNDDVRFSRNRVRRDLIPYLERHFSPAIVDALSRDASLAHVDAEYLDALAAAERQRVTKRDATGGVEVGLGTWLAEPEAIAWRLTRELLRDVSGGRFFGYDHVMAVVELARSRAGRRVELPGVVVARGQEHLRFEPVEAVPHTAFTPRAGHSTRGRVPGAGPRPGRGRRPQARATSPETNSLRISLSIPGEAVLGDGADPAQRQAVTAEAAHWPAPGLRLVDGKLDLPPEVGVVDAALLSCPLEVRFRRPGDRLTPLGLGGRKKLHDFFVDRKVARRERDRVPLVVERATDRIVWVAGHRIAEEFRVTERTEAVVILKLKHWSARA